MVKKGKIAHYRERLDKTLASHDLTDEKKLETLVRDQILRSEDKNRGYPDNVMIKRTAEVSNFLEMLRSASENYDASPDKAHHPCWKLKQDTEEFRVMYREGPVGSPFHSLLVEGYIDAPLDVCLCVSWETALYPRWFPETLIPTFKVIASNSLQKVRVGEEISLVRMKLSWPLSSREAILHYFEFEYLEDDLIIVLLNTIPDVDNIQMETHGFTNEGIPEAGHTVRIDVVGGFALQKVTENRSYFRTIANMDIKLDFVPPSLINFISRQLIGSGFRLYQKTVASVSRGDETFAKALSDPIYSRIREDVLTKSESKRNLQTFVVQDHETANHEERKTDIHDGSTKEDSKVLDNDHVNETSHEYEPTTNEIEEEDIKESNNKILKDMFKAEDQRSLSNEHANRCTPECKPATEIEEEEVEESETVLENNKVKNIKDTKERGDLSDEVKLVKFDEKLQISPQVEQALSTLDKIIAVLREGKLKAQGWVNGDVAKSSDMEKHMKWASTEETAKAPPRDSNNAMYINGLRAIDSDIHGCEANTAVTSPVQNPATANWSRNSPLTGESPAVDSPMTVEVNGIHENNFIENKKTGQPRKRRLCCLHLISGRLDS